MADGIPKLRVNRVSKSFILMPGGDKREAQTIEALRNVTFAVEDHEFVALIGTSGCGKTTLLKIVHGLLPADSGEIYVGEKRVCEPGYDRGMVFQHSGLLPWRTALNNVEFGLELKNVPEVERREVALQYLNLVGLAGFEHHHPHQLSGGMQQRVGLARALAIDPEVLLMDEPFGALDAQTRETLQDELLKIYAKTRKTILFVTHDLDEAVYLADRVVIMSARPGVVKDIVNIDLPRPRWEDKKIRANSEFVEKRAYIWATIKGY